MVPVPFFVPFPLSKTLAINDLLRIASEKGSERWEHDEFGGNSAG
jgi:hypothetical protein